MSKAPRRSLGAFPLNEMEKSSMTQVSDTIEIRILIRNDECTDCEVSADLESGCYIFETCYHGLTSLQVSLAKVGLVLDRLREGQTFHEASAD